MLPGFKSSRDLPTDDGICTVVCGVLASNSSSGRAVYSFSCDCQSRKHGIVNGSSNAAVTLAVPLRVDKWRGQY